jgi:hypothetical protein
MSCLLCGLNKESEFTAEMNIHLRGLAHVDSPGILLISKIVVCLDCGSSRFLTPPAELSQLVRGTLTREVSDGGQKANDIVFRRKIALRA